MRVKGLSKYGHMGDGELGRRLGTLIKIKTVWKALCKSTSYKLITKSFLIEFEHVCLYSAAPGSHRLLYEKF